jgi:hypothetical protein
MNHLRAILAIVGANIAGGVISLGLGSALLSQSVNFLQLGLILLGLALNMTIGTAMTMPGRPPLPGQPDV